MGLQNSKELFAAIGRAQTRFLEGADPKEVFETLLQDFLALTESGCGFFAEVLCDLDGLPYLKFHAIYNLPWAEAQGQRHNLHLDDLNSLLGEVVASAGVMILNDLDANSRGDVQPDITSGLNTFLAIPLMLGDEVLGMIGLGNRQEGYDLALVKELELLLATAGRILAMTQANKQRDELQARLSAIFDTAVDAIAVIDTGGIIRACNPAVEKLFGYRTDELLGCNISLLMPDSHKAKHSEYINRYMGGGESRVVGGGRELEGQHLDGRRFPIHISVSEFSFDGERFFTGIVRDISDFKQIASDLLQAKEEAERANQAKSDFLSSMSHELRTPLNAIMGFAQLFDYDLSASTEHKEAADEIYRAGKHLRTLIDDILDLAKIESGQFEISLEPVPVVGIIEECRKLVMPLADEKDVMLGMKLGQCRDQSVVADYTRLKQVLLNLLSNAIKYNREHGSVTLSCEKRPDGCLRIKVSDTGYGISEEDMGYVFKPFSRLANEHYNVEGTGIGLSISKQFVELMQGTIGVESMPGEGSTFWLDLKVAEPVTGTAPSDQSPTDESATHSSQVQILLIEDNPTNRTVFYYQFRALGYSPEIVSAPEEVLSKLEYQHYDLVLTDIHMPGMNGYELAQYIRRLEQGGGRHTPIIAVTANVLAGERERCLEAGMDDYISKPVDIDVLRATVNRWLSAERAESVAEPLAAKDAPQVLDQERLSSMVTEDSEWQEIINSFLESLPEVLDELSSAFAAGDGEKLAFWAHRCKSSALAIGADLVAHTCQAIENMAKLGEEMALIKHHMDALQSQVNELVENVEQLQLELEEKQTKAAIKQAIESNIDSVLVVDDDPVVLTAMVVTLRSLGVSNVFSAASGRDGLALMEANNFDIDVVICDLKMPKMDGVEYLRHLVNHNYRGAIILLSGEDSRILNSARQLADAHSFHFVAALQKPVEQFELAGVLAKINRKQEVVARPSPSTVSLQELEKAIEEDQFIVYYQPKIDAVSKQLLGVESLVRWQHPEKNFVMPDQFIPLAEEHGLIDELTDLVIEKSFAQLSRWRRQGIGITASINIAVGTIGRRIDFPERLMEALDKHQLEPQSVILELTESGLIEDIATSLDALVRLRLKGVTLSIDDFGTGYSTLKQLQGIPFTELKIDKDFVMNSDVSSRAILESSVLLGQKLGMKIVAEGVESMDDWELLKRLGCHILQGFYISRPMPGEQLEGWLKEWIATNVDNRQSA